MCSHFFFSGNSGRDTFGVCFRWSKVCSAVCFQHADGHGDAPCLEHDLVDLKDLEEVLRDGGVDDDVGAGGDQVEVLHGGREGNMRDFYC